ncbi:hypothetical protein [Enterococcus sp. LJL51]|uniref:hypothetical protein n=1 Tax=Enterococcus sp. LJL51 TaxID=3416656 RepID=UPI003CF7FB04
MKKMKLMKKRNEQKISRFLNELSHNHSINEYEAAIFDTYSNEYERMVSLIFSAHILYKGFDYACCLYKKTAKEEYQKIYQIVNRKVDNEALKKDILESLVKKYNRLLKNAPSQAKKNYGFEIFYGVTGGFRKKYKYNRRRIEQMYQEIESAPASLADGIFSSFFSKICRFSMYQKKRFSGFLKFHS